MLLTELAEAVTVKSTDTFWNEEKIPRPGRLYEACGNLVVINDEDQTVRLAHHTVQQFLVETLQPQELTALQCQVVESFHISIPKADLEIGEICVAYLSFSDFETQVAVSSQSMLPVSRLPEPMRVLDQATSQPGLSNISSSIFYLRKALRSDTRSSRPADFDVSKFAKLKLQPSRTLQKKYVLLDYTIQNWTHHTRRFSEYSTSMWKPFRKLALNKVLPFDIRPWGDIDELGEQPYAALLQWATSAQHLPLLRLLPQNSYDGADLLHQAIRDEDLAIATNPYMMDTSDLSDDVPQPDDLLLDYWEHEWTKYRKKTHRGESPLHWAAQNGYAAISEILINQGIDLEARNYKGETALHAAVNSGYEPTVELLVHKGANVEARTEDGKTALQLAIDKEYLSIARSLLS